MSTPVWQPGTLYNPGAVVRRVSAPPITTAPITNGSFEDGDTGWTKESGWTIENDPVRAFDGTWVAKFDTVTGTFRIISNLHAPVAPGQSITANCRVVQGASPAGVVGARIQLDWLDAAEALISTSSGSLVDSGSNNQKKLSTITAIAPAGAAFVRAAGSAFRNSGTHACWMDTFTWNYASNIALLGLVFTAVQPNAGYSGAAEPNWPETNGEQVIDNEVIWEATTASRVVWEANPILVSDYLEPDWPLEVGSGIVDGSIIWTAVSRRVTDARCPNTKVVAIAVSKIFCGDDDIIGFSATVNPLDWSSEEDAGYIPYGLQTYGANPVLALGLYRSNLIGFNSSGFQMWQVDQDPANMALLDSVPIGSTFPNTAQPVMNDLVFLSAIGVRSIGIAGASTNLQAGTFGEAVDPLVLAEIRAGAYVPFGTFVPAYGQYWVFFGPQVFVLTISDVKSMAWSRYVFPEAITDCTLEDNDLLLRTETHKVWRVTEEMLDDDHNCPTVTVDLPFMPDDLTAGALEIDANYVLDARSMADFGDGTIAPDSYGGSPVEFDPPAYAIAVSFMTPGNSSLSVRVHGTDADSNVVSEDITFDAGTEQRWIVGAQLFATITGTQQLNADDGDFQYCVGYQRFVADEDADALTVTIHGAITVENSDTPIRVSASGAHGILNDTASVYVLPADAVPIIRHNINTTTKDYTYTVDGGEAIVLPAGIIGRVVVGTVEVPDITQIVRSSGIVTPFVDVGIQFEVDASCTGTEFEGIIHWPYLDFGQLGTEKMFGGFDLVADAPEGVRVSIGYDQRDRSRRTADYEMTADTLPGQQVPIAVSGPSFDVRLTFNGNQAWEWQACVIYIHDRRSGS